MVKGVSRRVIVVPSPDTRFFEQAIFIMKDEAQKGVSPQRVLEEACRVADGYARSNSRVGRLGQKIPKAAFFFLGCAITALFWLLSLLI